MIRTASVLLAATRLLVPGLSGDWKKDQKKQYDAEVPKTILELQPFRDTSSIKIRSQAGREGRATLVNLNPAVNAWYLLKVTWKDDAVAEDAADERIVAGVDELRLADSSKHAFSR